MAKRMKKGPSAKALLVKVDLEKQLQSLNKYGKHYDDLVADYIYYLDLKDFLIQDIRISGLRIITTTGNGFETSKANESIQNLLKISSLMLKLLNDLGLQAPPIDDEGVNSDDYLSTHK